MPIAIPDSVTIAPEEYAYGWREVEKTLPTGELVRERLPLTLDDILHPEVGDYRMHTEWHERTCTYLYNVANGQIKDDSAAVAIYDVRVAWDHPTIRPHAPDVAVVFGVKERKNWSTFDCATEGTRPTVIFEVASPKTRSVDLIDKVDEYEEVGVGYYIIVDTRKIDGREVRKLIGHERTDSGFLYMIPDEEGRLWVEPLQMFVALEEGDVVCYSAENEPFPDYANMMRERDEAEKRISELEAELARLRAQLNSE